jgi:sugar phosphate permease
MLTDKGISLEMAALAGAAIGASAGIGRLLIGALIDRFWAPAVALPFLALPALSCLFLGQAEISVTLAVISAVIVGFAFGAETDLMAFLIARYFGLKSYGRLYGLIYVCYGLAAGISPFVFGAVFDATGSYTPVLNGAAVTFVLGALLLLALGRYPADGVRRA